MIDLSSLMPPKALLESKQHNPSFALKILDFFCFTSAIPSNLLHFIHTVFLIMLKEDTEMKMLKYFLFIVS